MRSAITIKAKCTGYAPHEDADTWGKVIISSLFFRVCCATVVAVVCPISKADESRSVRVGWLREVNKEGRSTGLILTAALYSPLFFTII